MAKKGYWVVCYMSRADEATMAEYGAAARSALAGAEGKILAANKPAKVGESAVDNTVVVVEFESVAKAVETYDSAAYQAAAKILAGKAKRDFRIVEGV